MTLYNVHIYRKMRLYFPDIEGNTPSEAAAIAAGKPSEDAEHTDHWIAFLGWKHRWRPPRIVRTFYIGKQA